jgi:tyrosine-protein kinase Etk/Wzc
VHSGLEKTIRPIVTEEHSSGAVEAYRALRTTVLTALAKANEKIVLVTSADSKEGKTLTTLNLAIMVAQMGKRVLLVDMDLRRGRLHRSLGIEREPGVTDCLRGGKSLREVIQPTRIENLWLAPTGSPEENAAELLQSSDIPGLFVQIQDDYDYIFLDSSPVLRVTDTVIVANQGVGVVLYVARVNHTPKPLVRYSLDMLRDAHILGMILNSIEMHKISSLYYTYHYPNYAYYSNAYAYGYDYYYYGEGRRDVRMRRRRRTSFGRALEAAGRWFRRTFLPME